MLVAGIIGGILGAIGILGALGVIRAIGILTALLIIIALLLVVIWELWRLPRPSLPPNPCYPF
ncbi:hypothetical protein [Desulfosporosinus sp. SB140]|uniref:hypothetical protein n=1 Tax=Desulfosporosinus paludis TaxID=3115649 RepID=UPI00388ECD7E